MSPSEAPEAPGMDKTSGRPAGNRTSGTVPVSHDNEGCPQIRESATAGDSSAYHSSDPGQIP